MRLRFTSVVITSAFRWRASVSTSFSPPPMKLK
jgi:hypothetical protein